MNLKKLLAKKYGDCESSLGVPMQSKLAKEIEDIIKTLPQECREAGLKRVSFIPKKLSVDSETRSDISIITNDAIDRDNEVVIAKGIDWRQFRKTGMPVMFAHDYNALPVGRAEWVAREKTETRDGFKAKTIYAKRPDGWQGAWLPDAIFSMIEQKMLSGKSIGFIPTEYSSPKPEEIKARPELVDVSHVIRKSIAIEYSVAPIQSNPEALIVGTKSFSSDLTDEAMEQLGIYLPTNEYEIEIKTEKALTEKKKTYTVISSKVNTHLQKLKQAMKARDF